MVKVVEGRSCKGCTLCCKLLGIAELEKPRATWCRHCDVKAGCRIHGAHPAECKEFYCGYLTNPALDEHWAPIKSKIVLAYDEQHAPRLSVHVDPARPNAWREEPYYSQIKRWAVAAPVRPTRGPGRPGAAGTPATSRARSGWSVRPPARVTPRLEPAERPRDRRVPRLLG